MAYKYIDPVQAINTLYSRANNLFATITDVRGTADLDSAYGQVEGMLNIVYNLLSNPRFQNPPAPYGYREGMSEDDMDAKPMYYNVRGWLEDFVSTANQWKSKFQALPAHEDYGIGKLTSALARGEDSALTLKQIVEDIYAAFHGRRIPNTQGGYTTSARSMKRKLMSPAEAIGAAWGVLDDLRAGYSLSKRHTQILTEFWTVLNSNGQTAAANDVVEDMNANNLDNVDQILRSLAKSYNVNLGEAARSSLKSSNTADAFITRIQSGEVDEHEFFGFMRKTSVSGVTNLVILLSDLPERLEKIKALIIDGRDVEWYVANSAEALETLGYSEQSADALASNVEDADRLLTLIATFEKTTKELLDAVNL